MFGPTEILMIVISIILLLVPLAAGIAIVVAIARYYSAKSEARLKARIDDLEKRLDEQKQK